MKTFIKLALLCLVTCSAFSQKRKIVTYAMLQSQNYTEQASNQLYGARLDSAIQLATKAIKYSKLNYNAYLIRAEAEMYSNLSAEAREDIEMALTLNPKLARAYDDLAQLDINNPSKALEEYTLAIKYSNPKLDKDNLSSYYSSRGDQKTRVLDWDGAYEDAQSALKLNSNNYSAYTIKAQVEIKRANYGDALKSSNKAIQYLPGQNAWAYYYRGIAEINLGNQDSACEDFAQAKKIGGVPDANYAITKYCQ